MLLGSNEVWLPKILSGDYAQIASMMAKDRRLQPLLGGLWARWRRLREVASLECSWRKLSRYARETEYEGVRISLLAADTLCDCGQEFRLVAFHQLQDSRFKLMEYVHACVVANGRTEVAGGPRNLAFPVREIRTALGSTVGGGRGQYTKQVRRVQPSSSRIIMRHYDARGRISRTA